MRIYISGPISDRLDGGIAAFSAASELIRSLGHTPVDPSILPAPVPNPKHHDYLRRDLALLKKCQLVCVLEGWEDSSGSLREIYFAGRQHIPCCLAEKLALLLGPGTNFVSFCKAAPREPLLFELRTFPFSGERK